MRNLKKYSNHSGYTAATLEPDKNKVSYCQTETHVHYDEKVYSSKIEYLQSDTNQYIETGVTPDDSTGIMVTLKRSNTTDTYLAGLRNDTNNTRWVIGSTSNIYAGWGSTLSSFNDNSGSKITVYLNYLNDRKWRNSLNDTYYSLSTLSFTPAYNIRLFGSAGVSASYTKWSGKIYAVKITQGSNVVMDLIPVRVKQVGYMYDKISGQLFGNSGTGNFTLGPDITE